MSSSRGPESPDPPVARSSDDQEKPAETNPLTAAPHGGWAGTSDPIPLSVIESGLQDRIDWHVRQAHSRALRAWADDPRGQAWVPGGTVEVKMSEPHSALLYRGAVVVLVHVPAFLLSARHDTVPGRPVSAGTPLRVDSVPLKAGHAYKIVAGPLYPLGRPGGDAL